MAKQKRKFYLYDGRKVTRLRSNERTYTFSSAGSQYTRNALEYAFLSNNTNTDFGPRAACEYAIQASKGLCVYCGLPLIVTITKKIIDSGVMMKEENGRLVPLTEEDIGFSIKVNDFQFDHMLPASEGGLAVAGNILLTCNNCNNLKSNMPIRDFVISSHIIHDAKVRRGDEDIPRLFIDDVDKHLEFFEPFVPKYYESTEKIGPEAIKLFDNATGFDSEKMIRERGHIDTKRILGMDDPDSYILYPTTHELRDLPHMTNRELNDLAQEQIARNNLLSDDSNRQLSFDYTDRYSDRYVDWELSINPDKGEDCEYKAKGVVSKAELQEMVRNNFGGSDLDADAERMIAENGDLTTGIYKSLEPILRKKAIEDDRKNEENSSNENYRSSIYGQTKKTFETAFKFLFRLDKPMNMPLKSEFKRLTGMDGSKPTPYDIWENLLFINKCLAATSNDDYLLNMCNAVIENNWSKDDLMREFRNGNLARKEIVMHYAHTPESEKTLYKDELDANGHKIRSNFSNNVSARAKSWRKAWEMAFGHEIDYDGPTSNEMLREMGVMDTLAYNDLEKPYDDMRAKFNIKVRTAEGIRTKNRKKYKKYDVLEKNWIRSGILDFEHGLDGLNKSIDRYVESKDSLSSKEREKTRNEFYNVRNGVCLLMHVIARKVEDGGPDSEWAKRGWTAVPPEDSDIASWSALPNGYTTDNIGNLIDSEWAKNLFIRYLDNTESSKRSEVGKMIDSMNSILSELAARKDEPPVKFIPSDRERSYIFWRMINEGAVMNNHNRRIWNVQVRLLFDMKSKRLFRYVESDNGFNSYDLIANLASFSNVDYVDLCEAMSEPSGFSRVQFITLDNAADLVSMETELDKAKDEDAKTLVIMGTVLKIYRKATNGISYSNMSSMSSNERTIKYNIVAKLLTTFRFYLTRVHKEISPLIVAHIPKSLMKAAEYEARHHEIPASKNVIARR